MKKTFFLSLLSLLALSVEARKAVPGKPCSHFGDGSQKLHAKTTVLSPLENQYDITHVKLDLAMTNTGTYLSGNAITTAKVDLMFQLNEYAFELDSVLVIDSLLFNGASLPVLRSGDLCIAALPDPVDSGAIFTAQLFYHGQPPAGSGLFTKGVNHATTSTGTQLTYTISDMLLAKDWWPCKQTLTDKIDSADIWITVPFGLKAGSNGLLKNVTDMGSGASRYEWKTRYPIDYYLIAAAVGPYAEYHNTIHYSGSTDSTPILSYVYDSATLMPLYQPRLDSMPMVAEYLSTLYGRYPFWQEKYGHCIAPLGGGMEHQTMTFIGLSSGAAELTTLAHELGHQWWGDCVTYGSWKDIWLSEGFATYTEHLFHEHFYGAADAKAWRTAQFNNAMSSVGGSTYVAGDTTDPYTVFNYRLTYAKGASIVHMLRYELNDDTTFFRALRSYQQQHSMGLAFSTDLKAALEAESGRNLDTFFTQWLYGEGYPKYAGGWNQVGNTVFVDLTQTASKPTVTPLFMTALDIRLTSATGDTTIRTRTSAGQQLYSFTWNKTATGVALDPDNHILNKVTGTIAYNPALSVTAPWAGKLQIAPNPTRDSWSVSGVPEGTRMTLVNGEGQEVYSGVFSGTVARVDATALPAGVYYLRLEAGNGGMVVRKLVRR